MEDHIHITSRNLRINLAMLYTKKLGTKKVKGPDFTKSMELHSEVTGLDGTPHNLWLVPQTQDSDRILQDF